MARFDRTRQPDAPQGRQDRPQRPTVDQPDWWPTRKVITALVAFLVAVGVELPPEAAEQLGGLADHLWQIVMAVGLVASWFVRDQSPRP